MIKENKIYFWTKKNFMQFKFLIYDKFQFELIEVIKNKFELKNLF